MQDEIVMTPKYSQKALTQSQNSLIRRVADNQKAAWNATFGGLRLVQAPGLPPAISISEGITLSRGAVDNFGAVEVAGIEPASPWVIIQDSNQSTPTASALYHDPMDDKNP